MLSSVSPPLPQQKVINKKKISVIGAGSWGSAIASKLGRKLQAAKDERNEFSYAYDDKVSLWVFNEMLSGNVIFNKWIEVTSDSTNVTSLVDIINDTHENVKYLKGVKLPSNIIATSDIVKAVEDADVLIFVVPHEFVDKTLAQMKGHCKDTCIVVSLTKGLHVSEQGPKLLSDVIAKELGIKSTAVLMGANCAGEVARRDYCEATVASKDQKVAHMIKHLFEDEKFRIHTSNDIATVELCGALKNIVAMGAGFCDALDYGFSSKAAIVRQGLHETGEFCKLFYPSFESATLMESCGVADLVATCHGGRNRKVSEEFGNRIKDLPSQSEEDLKTIWSQTETDVLEGQKMQGLGTLIEVITCLDSYQLKYDCDLKHGNQNHYNGKFPLFYRIYEISLKGAKLETLFDSW